MHVILTADTDRFIAALAGDHRQAQKFVERYNRVIPNYESIVYAYPTVPQESSDPLRYMDEETLRDARDALYDNASALVIHEIDDEMHRRTLDHFGEDPKRRYFAQADHADVFVTEETEDDGDGFQQARMRLEGGEGLSEIARILRGNGWEIKGEWEALGESQETWEVEVRAI